METPATNRNASLDALRAIAIVLVVFCHATTNYGVPNRLDFLGFGGVGVDLFFCLSGWLLGRQLCLEYQRKGAIEVRRFWLRRWMRTLPAYYAVLALTVLQALLQGKLASSWQYVVFLQNYTAMPFFGVSWSLCVEEHFYLLVAPCLSLFLRYRQLLVVSIALVLVPLACRTLEPTVAEWGWTWHREMTHLRYDQCAAGVVLAFISTFAPQGWRRLCRLLPVAVPLAVGIIGIEIGKRLLRLSGDSFDPLVWTFVAGTFVVLANSSSFWTSQMQIPGARFVAERAYALYLIHIEAIAVMNRAFGMLNGRVQAPLWLYLIGVWALSFAAAEVLYRLVERPGMRAREWFSSSRSASTRSPEQSIIGEAARA